MNTKLLKSVFAATAVLGASVGFATDFTLAQGGKWSDPATWGLTSGYPNATSDNVNVPSSLSGDVTVDLEGNAYGLLSFVNESSHVVTLKNGTINADTASGHLKINGANGGLAFEDGFTYTGFRIWPHNLSTSAATSMSFKNGTFNGNFSLSGFYGAGTFTLTAENAIVKHTQTTSSLNTLGATIAFIVKLGANNVDGGEAAIQFLGSGYSANGGTRTLTVDCEGKTVGKYAIIKDANAKASTRISALAESGTVNNLGSGLAAAFSWDSTDMTIYLTLTEGGGEQRALNEFVVNEGGDWNNANTWFHNPSQTYPNSASHTAYVTSESAEDAIVTVSSATLGAVQANSLVVSNDCAVTFKGTVSGAIFRFLTADTTGASGLLVQKGAKVTLDSVQCGNNYNSFYTWLNGSAELALVGNATLGGYLIRPNGNATDGYPTLSFKDGAAKWLLYGGAFQNATALTFKFDNATLTSNKGFNMLASKATWNIKMGANNTTNTAVFTAASGLTVQATARPAFIIDMTGKKSGTYPIISAKLGGQYQQVTASDFTVTCDAGDHFSVTTDKDTGISIDFKKARGLMILFR